MTADEPVLAPASADDEPQGGDSACWLHEVCDACGAVPDGPPGPRCGRCGQPRVDPSS